MIEDIFRNEPIDLVIKFFPNTIAALNQRNLPIRFDELVARLHEQTFACYFQKTTETEHKIIVPFETEGYQVEFITSWQGVTFNYATRTKSTPETTAATSATAAQHAVIADFEPIHATCCVRIIDIAVIAKPKDEQTCLFTFNVDLAIEEHKEYRAVEETMHNLGVENLHFDSEGSVQMTYDDIIGVLDPVLQREFKGIVTREKEIGCIISAAPRHPLEPLLKNNGFPQIDVFIRRNVKDNKEEIIIRNITTDKARLVDFCSNYGLKISGHQGIFTIINHGDDITQNKDFNRKNKIAFYDIEYAHVFPMPRENSFILNKTDFFDLILFKASLEIAYGKQNIIFKTNYIFSFDNEAAVQLFYTTFDFRTEIKKDLSSLDFDADFYGSSQSIFFTFTDLDDLANKIAALRQLNRFEIKYNPINFKYKVRTKLVSQQYYPLTPTQPLPQR